jgi:Glycosyl transferase family 2
MAMHGTSEREGAPTVSVILSVKNGGRDLPQAVGTILSQTYSNFELIAINTGSTDDTRPYFDSIPISPCSHNSYSTRKESSRSCICDTATLRI